MTESTTITAPGDGTFVAAATTIVAKCWGGSGSGGTFAGGKGGGGAGAFAQKSITGLTIGGTYNYHVGAAGEDSWVIDAETVLAKCGGNASADNSNGGTGGQATDCIGDLKHSGGNGGNGSGTGRGGGGGGAAGPDGDGGNGTNAVGGTPGTGGTGNSGGGNGGTGGAGGFPGGAGNAPGGGPGGGASSLASGTPSAGQIIIEWELSNGIGVGLGFGSMLIANGARR